MNHSLHHKKTQTVKSEMKKEVLQLDHRNAINYEYKQLYSNELENEKISRQI